MNFNLGGVGGYGQEQNAIAKMANVVPYKPRTLREQIQDQIAAHQSKIADLEAALSAMTPDVEKALDALQKLG